MFQLRLMGLKQELCDTLKSCALLCTIFGCDETIPEARPVSGFAYQALGCPLARPATRPLLHRCPRTPPL